MQTATAMIDPTKYQAVLSIILDMTYYFAVFESRDEQIYYCEAGQECEVRTAS
jgi:hypothetical protein